MNPSSRTQALNVVDHSQREYNTKTYSLVMGGNNRATEDKGLGPVYSEAREQAAVTVNIISNRIVDNAEVDMELIDEDADGEEREAKASEKDENHEETLSFTTASSSESPIERRAPILLPNILIPCTKCGCTVNICCLASHRSLHAALRTLKYPHDQRPKNLNALVRRRRLLILKQQQDASSVDKPDNFDDKYLHKLNAAFEVLRTDLQGNTDTRWLSDRNLEFNLKGHGFHLKCTSAVGVCEEANKKWKHMEDIYTYQDNFLDNVTSCFLAIYDGYSGRNTAVICSQHLHVFLKEELDTILQNERVKPTKRDIAAAFRGSFSNSELTVLQSRHERSQGRWSGCSAVTCVLTSDTCYIANAGNVGAVLLRSNNVVKVLTHKHDLFNKRERDRVRKSRGIVVKTEKCALINGALGVTRGIGSIGDMALKRCVISEPDVKCASLEPDDHLIILASGGFWRVFSFEETTHLVNGFFSQLKNEAKQQIIANKTLGSQTNNKHEFHGGLVNEIFHVRDTAQSEFPGRHCPGKRLTGLSKNKSEANLNLYFQAIGDFPMDNNDQISKGVTNANNVVTYDATKRKSDVNIGCLRHHRLSLPDNETIQMLKGSEEKELTRQEKASLLAKCLAKRLVKCALYAESMDNITVFVVLLPGFSMINWPMVRPDILEAMDKFIEDTP